MFFWNGCSMQPRRVAFRSPFTAVVKGHSPSTKEQLLPQERLRRLMPILALSAVVPSASKARCHALCLLSCKTALQEQIGWTIRTDLMVQNTSKSFIYLSLGVESER
jgi:hypothetical protein